MPACPSDTDLTGFLNESLPPDRAGPVSSHVDDCPSCQSRLDKLTEATEAPRYRDLSTLTRSGGPVAEEPPPDAVTRIPGQALQNIRGGGGLPAVPGFDVVAELGRGGMGVVYKARHRRLNRLVALKMILGGGAADPKTVQRFLLEAEVLARVRHPQVVQVYEVDTYEGLGGVPVPYLAMELLEGGTLGRRLKDGPLPPREAAELMEGLARAVHAAHLQGVVHRDLKPGNILFPSAELGTGSAELKPGPADGSAPSSSALRAPHSALSPKVSDFGLAKFMQDTGSDLTHSGQIVGTPAYMAPEQASGARTLGPGADVYALGAILYECLTGRRPFEGAEPISVLLRVVNEPPVDVRTVRPGTPRDVAAVAMKCLEKDPKRRYASAGELADDLHRFLTNRPTIARPATGWERARLWVKRNTAEAILLAALAVVVATAFVAVAGQWARAEDRAAAEHRAMEQAEAARTEVQTAHQGAMAALAEAGRQKTVAELREARLGFAHARDWCEQGQVEHGLGQFVRALELAEANGDADLARVIRTNLAAWAAELPPPRRAFPHKAEPRLGVFTPDGKQLVTAGRECGLHLWDPNTGALLRTYETSLLLVRPLFPTFTFWTAAVSPDGKTIAAGGSDGQVWVWDVDRPAPRAAFTAATGEGNVYCVAFAPDGTLWAVDGEAGVKRWDLAARRAVTELMAGGPGGTVVQVLVVSADGGRVYTGDRGGRVREWDVGAKAVAREWELTGWINDLALAPDGKELAATGTDGLCHVFDLGTGKEVYQLNHAGAYGDGVAFLPDGSALLTSDGDGTVRAWNRATRQPVGVAARFRGEVNRLRARPGTDQVAVPAGDTVYLYRALHYPGLLLNPGNTSWVRGVDVSPDGGRTAVAAGDRLTVYHTRTGAVVAAVPVPRGTIAVRFDPVRPRVLRGTRDSLEAVSLPGGEYLVGDPATVGRVADIVVTPDGATVLTCSPGTVSRWDAAGLRLAQTRSAGLGIPPGQSITTLALRPDGGEALIAFGTRLKFLNPRTMEIARDGWDAEEQVLDARYTPDGKRILAGLRDSTAELLDAADGRPVLPPLHHARAVSVVGVSPDGAVLLTGSRDGTGRFWDAATGLALGPPLRHPGPLSVAVYSPAGDRVATGTSTGQAFTWKTPPPPLGGSLDEVRAKVREWTGETGAGRP
ncbi:MAG: pknB 39 [Gemmataceae bacterium]|nr:pknB 39 [Gemmataceae bacterium]